MDEATAKFFMDYLKRKEAQDLVDRLLPFRNHSARYKKLGGTERAGNLFDVVAFITKKGQWLVRITLDANQIILVVPTSVIIFGVENGRTVFTFSEAMEIDEKDYYEYSLDII